METKGELFIQLHLTDFECEEYYFGDYLHVSISPNNTQ